MGLASVRMGLVSPAAEDPLVFGTAPKFMLIYLQFLLPFHMLKCSWEPVGRYKAFHPPQKLERTFEKVASSTSSGTAVKINACALGQQGHGKSHGIIKEVIKRLLDCYAYATKFVFNQLLSCPENLFHLREKRASIFFTTKTNLNRW